VQLLNLPAFDDNYIWLLADANGNALVVDPGDAAPVEAALDDHGWRLRAILLTHHHADHTGGVGTLVARHQPHVFGPHDARIVDVDTRVGDGDSVELDSPRCRFRVIAVPGHTLSHVAYAGEGLLFCGDTLFSLGCGRLFEGTPAQMLDSLERLADLPDDTRVCCAHEYTRANAAFALSVDPDNPDLRQRAREVDRLRAAGQATLPIDLGSEKAANPFLRIDAPSLKAWAATHAADAGDRVQRFAALRAAKDGFRA
jgi:hydroxyacylglutathione hydrolase